MPDDLETGSASGATDTGTDSGGTDQGTEKPEGTSGAETDTSSGTDTVNKTEFDKVLARMRAADQRASEREAELKRLRDKDLPEAEKLKRDYEDLAKKYEQTEAELRKTRIRNAFLEDNTYEWQDAGAALKLVDMSEVDIDSDGNVTGLKDALKRLATSHKWMLKSRGSSGEDEAPGSTKGAGAPPMNGRTGSDKPDINKLAQRLPAMRTRIRPTT